MRKCNQGGSTCAESGKFVSSQKYGVRRRLGGQVTRKTAPLYALTFISTCSFFGCTLSGRCTRQYRCKTLPIRSWCPHHLAYGRDYYYSGLLPLGTQFPWLIRPPQPSSSSCPTHKCHRGAHWRGFQKNIMNFWTCRGTGSCGIIILYSSRERKWCQLRYLMARSVHGSCAEGLADLPNLRWERSRLRGRQHFLR